MQLYVANGRKRYGILPEKVRYTIKALAQWAGWKLTQIATALDEPYSTVHTVVNEAVTPQVDRAKRSLRKYGTPVANRIIAFVTRDENGRRATYNQIKTALELECSESTIRRRLQESGYHRLVARYAPWLNDENMDLRSQFGEWCLTQMPKPFIFGDAVVFGRGGTQQQRVTRRPGEAYDPDCLQPLYRDLENAHYCYGFICGTRKSRLIHWDRRVFGTMTQATLVEHVLPELVRFWQECTFAAMDDGVPEDTSFDPPPAYTTALSDSAFHAMIQARIDVDGHDPAIIALEKMPVLVLDGASTHKGQFQREIEYRGIPHTLDIWPPNSPDLNCIENVWALMKARINRQPHANTNEQLIAQVQEQWDKLSEEEIEAVTVSFRRRMELLGERDGMHIGY